MANPHPRGYQLRPTRRRVTVTAGDISRAKTSDSTNCAIARAVASSIPGASHILVDIQHVRFTHDGGTKRSYYDTPPEVQRYLFRFDKGEDVEPFAFELRTGTVHDVARRPGVGGRPKGTTIASRNRKAPVHKSSSNKRRAYGARSLASLADAPLMKRAMSHA